MLVEKYKDHCSLQRHLLSNLENVILALMGKLLSQAEPFLGFKKQQQKRKKNQPSEWCSCSKSRRSSKEIKFLNLDYVRLLAAADVGGDDGDGDGGGSGG
ncbi:hypothetical protein T02_7364 [Trichinella nativa]|uniref:Uncharacterized protein n=1 Tax=Trichinella nativa TaxID=6335 RepID=A0A0V1L0X2_9BILA|nr:hypothetical protein T02_7364 [Trichinella nativa]